MKPFRVRIWVLVWALAGWQASCESSEGLRPDTPKVENIFGAAMEGDLPRVQFFLAQDPARLNAQNQDGLTPLHLDAWKGQAEVVRYLLDEGANPNLADRNGDTPLHFAAAWGYRGIVEALLAKGAKVNARNMDGKTPLSRVLPRPEIAQVLKAHGGVE